MHLSLVPHASYQHQVGINANVGPMHLEKSDCIIPLISAVVYNLLFS